METVSAREARERLAWVLDRVEAGEEVVIQRQGRPVARLVRPRSPFPGFPDRSGLRAELPPCGEGGAEAVRAGREEERF